MFGGYNKLKDKFLLRRFFNMFNEKSNYTEEEVFEFFSQNGIHKSYLKALVIYGLNTNESEATNARKCELYRILNKYEIDHHHDFMLLS